MWKVRTSLELTQKKRSLQTTLTMFQSFNIINDCCNSQTLIENMHNVRDLERKSDEIAFKLSENITAGAVSPNLIDNLIESTHLADNIVDIIFYLSRELSRMAKTNTTNFASNQETEWAEGYTQILTLADRTLAKLHQMLSTGNVPEIMQLRKEIEALEEQGDDIKDAGFDKLYSMASKMHFLQFSIIVKCCINPMISWTPAKTSLT